MRINIFYTTCSNIRESQKLAKCLLSSEKIVCVNVIKNVESFYKEDGKLKKSMETILIIKTSLGKNKIENLIKRIHPYDIPFITQLKNDSANIEYLQWVRKNL